MCPRFIVIERVGAQGATQVPLAEYHEVVNALAKAASGDRRTVPTGYTRSTWNAYLAEMGL